MDVQRGVKLGRLSVLIGVVTLVFIAAVYVCALEGIAAKVIDYGFLVYAALAGGVLGFFGACAALVALLRAESRRPVAYIGLALNLMLLVVGGCFTILV